MTMNDKKLKQYLPYLEDAGLKTEGFSKGALISMAKSMETYHQSKIDAVTDEETENKLVIQRRKDEKWCNLDYLDRTECIYSESFLGAYKFKSKKEAIGFLKNHNLKIIDYELFKLNTYAEPLIWGE